MKKKILLLILIIANIVVLCSCKKEAPKDTSAYNGVVTLYSTMSEQELMLLKDGFEQEYLGLTLNYYSDTADRIINKLATDYKIGNTGADVVLLGDGTSFEDMKEKKLLKKYVSNESRTINGKYKDIEGYYCGVTMDTICLAWYNHKLDGIPKNDEPKKYKDLEKEIYKDKIILTDPNVAQMAKVWVTYMMQNKKYGEDFFKKLKENGAVLDPSIEETGRKVGYNMFPVGVCFDSIIGQLLVEENDIGYRYPSGDFVTVYRPIGLLEKAPNEENGKALIDYLLSKKGQEYLTTMGLISVRKDVKNVIDTKKILGKCKKMDMKKIRSEMEESLAKFNAIFNE